MAIGHVEYRNKNIYVYDTNNRLLWNKNCDELKGYTNSTVSFRCNSVIYVHDEKGRRLSNHPA